SHLLSHLPPRSAQRKSSSLAYSLARPQSAISPTRPRRAKTRPFSHPSFNHDVGTDLRDHNITESDRIREMRRTDTSDSADRIVPPQYFGSDEVNHPINDTALQG